MMKKYLSLEEDDNDYHVKSRLEKSQDDESDYKADFIDDQIF
jgi:hypothetical protein